MNGQLLVLTLIVTLAAFLQITVSEKHLHRLVGGHLKIVNPDPYDAELLTAEASGSRDKKNKSDDSEDKKTLSQQVADGKYGLIQNELFTKTPKRPGVLSYETNSEVPKDNINNLGGLNKNEIWLAENHLLVLKGGSYPPYDEKFERAPPLWPAIDDFKAPLRQVKIPAHPKVPPPFPVQLSDDGPLQILGTNDSRTINGTIEATAYALPPPEGYEPGTGPYFPPFYPNQANVAAGQIANSNPAKTSGEYPAGAPFPPFLLNGTLPPYFASLPPGAAIVPPPPENLTELYDEDDPSIYYPPPYSFFYPKYNGSLVPPGPLVPGIILPPPPNFFAPLEETTTTMKPRRIPTTTTQIPQIHPTTTPLPSTKPKKPIPSAPNAINEIKSVITTKAPKLITILPVRINKTSPTRQKVTQKIKKPAVTILRPIKTSTLPPKVFAYDNEITRTKPEQPKTIVSTTQVPLKIYYSTSNDIETNSVTPAPEKFHIGLGNPTKVPKILTKPPAKYYFYEEDDNGKTNIVTPVPNYYREISTTPRSKQQYYNQYYVPPPNSRPVLQPKPQFIYVTNRPYNTQRPKYRLVPQRPKTDTFSIHIAKLQKQIQQFTTSKPYQRHSPKPVYQYSFEAANYHHPQNNFKSPQVDDDKFRPLPKYSVQIQQAVEVIPPKQITETVTPVYEINYQSSTEAQPSKYYKDTEYDYEDEVPVKKVKQPHTISQYSFEVTPNPVYQGYYTKPDEGYFDDNTKKYFTVFGQKIASSGTSPIPQIDQSTRNPIYNNRNLEGDIAVNYLTPKPPINPHAEQIENVKRDKEKTQGNYSNRPISNAQIINPGYPQVVRYVPKTVHRQVRPPNLEGDTIVNYVHPRPGINPQAEIVQKNNYPINYSNRQSYNSQKEEPEIIKAIPVNVQTPQNPPPGSSYISYELPGDNGAHFYFLTPQLAQRRDQGVGYFYAKPNAPRFRRNERTKDER